ncbi:hypothetical protein J8273_0553 [Carpediemonas membranifera]|uniref:Reverse transcriptase domain-containing protein n=1 Tax=Carpediemonas membranifera TaxID=201153 RepID=A0A8J6EAT5_9EUKA|nr:hypothetical protein J8273_0553 [Carpediemonas membranifera]|eukprot:KAG9395320.1 hypothetical protein J8273_0553 [Carpediemonas membranifera]
MVSLSIDYSFPSIEAKDLTQKRVRAFKREVRVFKTRHPDFKIALLLCDSLQKEIEIHYGLKRAEDLSEEQVFDFLTKESMPKSLSALKTQLKQLQCSTTAISKLPLTTCVREFIADFMELAELAETVALNDDATRAMIPLYGLKSAEEAFIDEDGTAKKRTVQRQFTVAEAARLRADKFDKVAREIFLKRIKPKALFERLDLESKLCEAKTLTSLVAVARAVAKAEEAQPTPDPSGGGEPPNNNISLKGSAPQTQKSETPSTVLPVSGKRKMRPCRHCGQMHYDNLCPKRTGDHTLAPFEAMEAGDEALTTKAIVNGRDYIMVVDTGATHPFIPENTLREMKENDPGIKTIPCPTFRVRVAGGAIVTGKTAVELTITLPDIGPRVLIVTIRMLVIPGSGRMLLGCSALRALGLLSDEGLHIYKPQTPSQATDGDDDIALDHPYLACAVEDEGSDQVSLINIPDSEIAGEIRTLAEKYAQIFDPHLPESNGLKPMTIELTEDTTVRVGPRPLNAQKRHLVEEEVARLEKEEIVRPSVGPFASPVVVVSGGHKGSDKIRLCIDYKSLNAITVKDHYPLPNIQEFVREAAGCKYYATLDLRQGYYQLSMAEEDVHKTAFITPDNYMEFLRCPFGLTNAPSRFQREMDRVYAPLLHKGTSVYIDDIFVYARSKEEFLEILERVFQRTDEFNLRLKAPKCTIGAAEAEVVGYILDAQGQRLAPSRIEAVLDMPPPTNYKALERTLGSLNYVSRFVDDSSRVLTP